MNRGVDLQTISGRMWLAQGALPDTSRGFMYDVDMHFTKQDPTVRAAYNEIVRAAKALGPVKEEAKKTSIHLVRRTAFAGVATRRSWLILTLKSDTDVDSPRVVKREQVSAGRWHIETKIDGPQQVNQELKRWMKRAYELSE